MATNEHDVIKNEDALNKWRLILGKYSQKQIPFEGDSDGKLEQMEDVLDFLYSHEYTEDQDIRERTGGAGESRLTVPSWIQKMKTLFPQKTYEIMEGHALEKYNMTELLTDPDILRKLEPNRELLKTIMSMKHLMHGEVLNVAREIVRQVAQELSEKMRQEIKQAFSGRLDRTMSSPVKSVRNLDIKKTIQHNLKNYDIERQQLMLKNVYFSGRQKRYNTWRVIICVDESGSMLDSIIHSAVMAGIFASLPSIDTRLVIFDTSIVDLSDQLDDPVGILMSVTLGGGTNIGGALAYCQNLIEAPQRTMVVLVSDLFEGVSQANLLQTVKGIVESGAKMVALTALDQNANPVYDKRMAKELSALGAHVGAMTPEQLVEFMTKVM